MPKEPRILAINPGTRYLGVAFFLGAELRDWGVKTIKGKFSQGKLRRILAIISGLIREYELDILVLKRLHPSRSSPSLRSLVKRIKGLARRRGLKFYQYSIDELKTFFLAGKRGNKQNLAEVVASIYPHLFIDLERERGNENPYYLRMFEAVALGSFCFQGLDEIN